jgi:hypothetical protein
VFAVMTSMMPVVMMPRLVHLWLHRVSGHGDAKNKQGCECCEYRLSCYPHRPLSEGKFFNRALAMDMPAIEYGK